jgi:hypothetical protein
MDASRYNGDGTVALVDGGHQYTLTLADCTVGAGRVAQVTTPPLACLVCGMVSTGTWSAAGSREAQLLVARALAAGAQPG